MTPPPEPPEDTDDLLDGNPDHAWKALGLIVDWIKHAETKAGATLAAAGVTGGVLYNLVKSVNVIGAWLAIASVLCAIAVLVAGASAALALVPRLGARGDAPISPLYYKHIAEKHPTKPHTYFLDLHRLTASSEDLVREIAEQVWANSHVALRKYTWGSRAVVCLVAALASLAWVAVILAIRSVGG
ncbi:Pycsar system effector family protein [Blastococcus sp. KM273129]|uniref:Pycsar system effector family protein n=1 Tax=Blastococcus sp. KM273129 TaxID=2570315 RepID=UPI001F415A76|nr:Pycsar system effector family protein [Blastococcus sp. KM273129]MCF6733713.1 hypothetical protein [Blastococcus sp. KM273129]